ncbi:MULTISPECIES: PQQ-dependent sugar dehydrogenase [unclassified Amycolatopsis]|uniref:PQQ-dependent sugar dehydrogenase n=1 Tax=unclassified Amycolatopsis TaxID=2618356 RepID=UPI002876283F|nr:MULTISPECIES: PQQ-dependent sugar dehydrogenase [unclassified Amycolatopsis]MDS0133850.1 PQQ-dependent sugar dehydrogenase [Amycolatopsis sp. 505]MDS0144726.1 PQQ-dependent sugar dehydrogenase [Amycolatopsis sp. CM201R]
MAMRTLRLLLTAVLVGALLPVVSPGVATAVTLPPGFVLRDTDTGLGPYELTDFAYLPDNSVLATGKSGAVRWLPVGGAGRTIATLPVRTEEDLGLVGVAVAPGYATSRAIYLTRSINAGGGFVMRLSKFTVTVDAAGAPTGLTGEQPLFEVPGTSNVHGIDAVIAAPDGTLWLSVGDSSDYRMMDPAALRALDVNQPYGKIFHLTASGQGVPGNPYYDAADPGSTASKVFARGFRNPFRFSIDPNLGLPVAGDVGWSNWEEVDVVQRGANHGWPCWEGSRPTPGYSGLAGCAGVPNQPPIHEYTHGTGPMNGNSVTGGIVYSGASYPAAYRGSYFFGDYVANKVWTLRYDGQGKLSQAPENPPVFTGVGGPVKFAAAPNGDIVFADILSGNVRRLSYSAGNTAPVAKATTATNPDTRTVTFDGSASVDYDNDTLAYDWEFGDGTTAADAGPKVSHTYPAGTASFTAKLRVRDPLGLGGEVAIVVAPGNRTPALTLNTPGSATFAVNQTVSVSATASDAEDGALPITWTTAVRHCPSEATCHSHPGVGGTGSSFSQPFTAHPDSRMELTATVTDSAGVTTAKTYTALPRQHRITLRGTQPAELSIPVAGGVSSAMVTEGASFDVEAAPLAIDGVSKFTGWQGGPADPKWIVTVGSADLTLTANYATPIDQRYDTDPALRASLGAPAGAEITDGPVHYRVHANGRLYWSAGTGTRYVTGPVLDKYLALGGHALLGPPTSDTATTPDGVAQYNHFLANGTVGSIYSTAATGAHLVTGEIRKRWAALDYERGVGYPTTDELATPDGVARYNHFVKGGNVGSIYYTVATGGHAISGEIRKKWAALDYERGLGYPTTDELGTPDGVARYNHFAKGGTVGSIYYTAATGARAINGEIRKKWAALDYERGLGYPTTDELATPDGRGRYNHFTKGGSIYYTTATGAHMVKGEIRNRWAALGWEYSYLRYPKSDEYVTNGWYRSDFEGGYITYSAVGSRDFRW